MISIGIEASNIRAGGGVTHLSECLGALEPADVDVERVIVYGGKEILERLPERSWLDKRQPTLLHRGSWARLWWRYAYLTQEAAREVDILLVPGGSYTGTFRPFVALAQNLLPFDQIEQCREGWSLKRLRLLLLERIQGATFRHANGVIYISAISRDQIERRLGFSAPRSRVIHHGTTPRFFRRGPQSPMQEIFSEARPLRLLYVSILEPYKHQRVIATAVARMRARGLAVTLDLIGPGAADEVEALRKEIARLGVGDFVRYHGAVAYDKLQQTYADADAFVFGSSCETFGIILLEAMAAGLPLLCSHRSALPEVAGNSAVYFDPLDPASLAREVELIYFDSRLRQSLAFRSVQRASEFSWEKCARETFSFVREIHATWRENRKN